MKKTMILRCLFAVAAVSFQLGGPQDALAQTGNATLYEGARLILGDGSTSIENSAFLVQGGRFSQIGNRGQVQAPAGAARVDLSGQTVMPTLVNTHMHIGPSRSSENWLDVQASRAEFISDLHQLAYAGFAAVATAGWVGEAAFQVRAEHHPNAARIMVSGRGASAPLGQLEEIQAAAAAGEGTRMDEANSDVTSWIYTERQAKIYIRERAAQSVDLIKIWVDDRLGTELTLSPNLYGIIIDEAHKHNIPVYAHIWHRPDAKGVARAGADMLAHPVRGDFIDDELVQLMKDNNTVQQTNMAGPWEYTITEDDAQTFWDDPFFRELSTPQQAQAFRERAINGPQPRTHEGQRDDVDAREFNLAIYQRIVSNHARLYEEGVTIALGTDGGSGFRAHKTMELLVDDVGLTPLQVIEIATKNAAISMGLDKLGTVETGKDASFIVLDANPLDDITNTRQIADVYLQGHRVDRDMIRNTYLP